MAELTSCGSSQNKFGLFCEPHRAEPQPMGGGGINGWKTSELRQVSVSRACSLMEHTEKASTLPPGPQAQALRAML